eukprot:CAMPEP_0117657266 /NCGR_PEP_ID=MMETSP0804-20121206/5239_1 /TAXON_ID=1074897 /ORGANISM="Tetraselmis astigmatica, Strain CCMP880" /LENGTH=199 /DNA_ID=CAMNT_0005463709 /DNA_START=491 /DNA_END=1089 /DNA_ORIENTATION=+
MTASTPQCSASSFTATSSTILSSWAPTTSVAGGLGPGGGSGDNLVQFAEIDQAGGAAVLETIHKPPKVTRGKIVREEGRPARFLTAPKAFSDEPPCDLERQERVLEEVPADYVFVPCLRGACQENNSGQCWEPFRNCDIPLHRHPAKRMGYHNWRPFQGCNIAANVLSMHFQRSCHRVVGGVTATLCPQADSMAVIPKT